MLYWVMTVQKPTDTLVVALSNDDETPLGGVKKGAFTREEAERRFAAWNESEGCGGKILQRQNWQTARRLQKANVLKKKKQRTQQRLVGC